MNTLKDPVERIRMLEKEYEAQKENARSEMKHSIALAGRSGERLIEDSRASAEVEIRQMMAEASLRAEARSREIAAESRAACDQCRAAAQQRMEEAVAYIVRRVVN